MIYIDETISIPIYVQIYEQLKNDILKGNINAGEKLISTRTLAKNLCVARNTVENAYGQLSLEGYVVNKPCSGFIVQNINKNLLMPLKQNNEVTNTSTNSSSVDNQIYDYDFQYGNIGNDKFPYSLWRKLTNEALLSADRDKINFYNDKQGELDLRIEIMKYIKQSRGVSCTPDQIVLCPGMQFALDLICKLISKEDRILAIEEPGYDGARKVFENNAFEILPIPVENDGISINYLESTHAKIVYITPSHQFPTGSIMPIKKRNQLLTWSIKNNAFLIEDDYDSEFRYNSRPIPSLQSIDNNNKVVYIGTFSKSLSPGLRISYMVLPKPLLLSYNSVFDGYNSAIPWLHQRIITLFIKGGYLERHIRKACNYNKKKHDLLILTIKKLMNDKVIIHGNNAGLHIILEFVNDENHDWLIQKASEQKVKVYPTTSYWYNKEKAPKNLILLGFSLLGDDDIVNGIKKLKKAWFD